MEQNSFFSFAPIKKKTVKPEAAKRKSRDKLSSKILTSTPMKEQLEEAEKKRRNAADKKAKSVKRNFYISEKKVKKDEKKIKKLTIKRRKLSESSSSNESESSNDLCDDDELDDVDLYEHFANAMGSEQTEELCGICNKFGRDGELWYRCIRCSTWNHAACSGADQAEGYLCDFCSPEKIK
ncbi:unnamed protein product [Ceutorhynchus assimilis]|uniref:Uncharacterized protein n=1 Tax=Ceutorhynchus assimilis TaxID=467358 RepID=A0A9N9MX68_9CUCU|nr:unnamed protein product [Ceutorhynchus assimilis]